jgi:hypothetical protein
MRLIALSLYSLLLAFELFENVYQVIVILPITFRLIIEIHCKLAGNVIGISTDILRYSERALLKLIEEEQTNA